MDNVLLVEDDTFIAEGLRMTLKLAGFSVTHAATIKEAALQFSKGGFSMVLLDVNLPDGNGFDFCTEARSKDRALPVIMLTAKSDEDSVVKGFTAGATDYIRKPFGSQELLARMKRLMNRDLYNPETTGYDALKLSLADRRAIYDSVEMNLTTREFDILALLARRGGSIAAKEHILAMIDEEGNIFEGTLASHISNLRHKLMKASNGKMNIASVYGQGYRLEKR